MQILTYKECNEVVKEKAKYWTLQTYIKSWPLSSFKMWHINPLFYIYCAIISLALIYLLNFDEIVGIILGYLGLNLYLYTFNIVKGLRMFCRDHPEVFWKDYESYFDNGTLSHFSFIFSKQVFKKRKLVRPKTLWSNFSQLLFIVLMLYSTFAHNVVTRSLISKNI